MIPETNCKSGLCRLVFGRHYTTLAHSPPQYTNDGRVLWSDPNTTKGRVDCLKCGASWDYTTSQGTTTFYQTTYPTEES
jgi:hypothetical protein